jgi:hypothetical protein
MKNDNKKGMDGFIELEGVEALEYIDKHLKIVRVDAKKWETEYINEETGERWLEYYPHSELQGGGSPYLRKI